MRPTDLLLAVAVVGGAIGTYSIKHDAEDAADRVSGLRRQIAAEEERIVFLRADWAYLSSPARLEKLTARFGDDLELRPVEAHQWVEPFQLPPPDMPPDPVGELAADEMPLVTGSVAGGTRATTPRPRPVFVTPKRTRRAAIPTSIDDLLRDR